MRIVRQLQKIFGDIGPDNQFGQFGSFAEGSLTTTKDIEQIQSLGAYAQGWFGAIIGGGNPALEDMNSMYHLFSYQLAYMLQEGVAEYNVDTTYFTNSLAKDPSTGTLFRSLTDDNLGNPLSDDTNWEISRQAFNSGLQTFDFETNRVASNIITDVTQGTRVVVVNGVFNNANSVDSPTVTESSIIRLPHPSKNEGQEISVFISENAPITLGDGSAVFSPFGLIIRSLQDGTDLLIDDLTIAGGFVNYVSDGTSWIKTSEKRRPNTLTSNISVDLSTFTAPPRTRIIRINPSGPVILDQNLTQIFLPDPRLAPGETILLNSRGSAQSFDISVLDGSTTVGTLRVNSTFYALSDGTQWLLVSEG